MVDGCEQIKRQLSKSQSIDYGSVDRRISQQSFSSEKQLVPKPKSRYTSVQWCTLLTLAFGNFCVGACVSLQAPFFPAEAERKGANPTQYGLIFGVYQLTMFIVAPFITKLVPLVSPKLLLNAGMLTVGITCILFGTLDMTPNGTPFVTLAFVVRIVEGVGASVLKTSCYTIVGYHFHERIATTFATLETFLGLGLIIGPTIGGALYDFGGYGLPFYVVGSLVIINAGVIFFNLPNVDKASVPEKGNLLKFWLHFETLVYSLSVFSTFNYIGFNAVALEPHLRQFSLSGFELGMTFALSGTVYGVTAPAWGWLADKKCSNRLLSIVGVLLSITSLFLIGPAPFLDLDTTLPIVLSATVLSGLGVGNKLVNAFSGCLTDTLNRGFAQDLNTYALVSSMIATSQSLGAFVGPSLGGILLQKYKYRKASMGLFAMESLLLVLLIIASVKERYYTRREVELHEIDRIAMPTDSISIVEAGEHITKG